MAGGRGLPLKIRAGVPIDVGMKSGPLMRGTPRLEDRVWPGIQLKIDPAISSGDITFGTDSVFGLIGNDAMTVGSGPGGVWGVAPVQKLLRALSEGADSPSNPGFFATARENLLIDADENFRQVPTNLVGGVFLGAMKLVFPGVVTELGVLGTSLQKIGNFLEVAVTAAGGNFYSEGQINLRNLKPEDLDKMTGTELVDRLLLAVLLEFERFDHEMRSLCERVLAAEISGSDADRLVSEYESFVEKKRKEFFGRQSVLAGRSMFSPDEDVRQGVSREGIGVVEAANLRDLYNEFLYLQRIVTHGIGKVPGCDDALWNSIVSSLSMRFSRNLESIALASTKPWSAKKVLLSLLSLPKNIDLVLSGGHKISVPHRFEELAERMLVHLRKPVVSHWEGNTLVLKGRPSGESYVYWLDLPDGRVQMLASMLGCRQVAVDRDAEIVRIEFPPQK